MKTLVVGASTNPERYSFKAANMLVDHGHEIELYGLKKGSVRGVEISSEWPEPDTIDTVTLYVGPNNQGAIAQNILDLKPRRVIFNPGTENKEFEDLLKQSKIEFEEACTLVLLTTNQF